MKTLYLVGSLALLGLTQSFARGEENADSTLPPRIARFVQDVSLTEEQQAAFQALNREFEARLAEARRQVAARELAKWRLDVIERDWCERVELASYRRSRSSFA